ILLTPQSSQASDLLRPDLHSLAEKITVFLKEERQTSIAVGNFSSPPALLASSGAGIKKVLMEEFEGLGIHVDRNAALVVKGDYGLSYNEKSVHEGYIFGRVIRAAGGQILFQFKQPITHRGATEQLIGGTVQLESDPSKVREESPNTDYANDPPNPSLDQQRVQPAPSSPYSIQVVIEGMPVTPILQDGLPFVPMDRGESYQVRLRNDSNFDAAVRLSLDGLSMFAFNQTGEDLKHVIVPSGKTVTIPGWFFTYQESREFEVTTYPESAVAMLGAPEDEVGTITATFAAAWDPTDPASAPADEREITKGGLATGVGDRVTAEYRKKNYEIGKIRSVITVRYLR
ncbi:MAG: hypothetical protein KC994_14955, partial [Candidatus Omnitrophica bacterium]|nr:hypothetical protein [Candidatus Omnitrophota bacterium]